MFTYDTTSDKVDAGQDGTEQAWDASPSSNSWTAGIDYLPGGSGNLTGHSGPYNSGDATDNRPREPAKIASTNVHFEVPEPAHD